MPGEINYLQALCTSASELFNSKHLQVVKIFLSFTIVFFIYLHSGNEGLCNDQGNHHVSEICYLDNNYVLLYKIINWWNDSLPSDDTAPCGNSIKCQSIGNVQVNYIESNKTLVIENTGDFAGLLSVIKQCRDCPGPSHFECTWINNKKFNTLTTKATPQNVTAINTLHINSVSPEQANHIRSMEDEIVFVVEGRIAGLLLQNGKIALHHSGEFLKACPKTLINEDENSNISLVVKNSITEEVFAQCSAVFKR